MHPHPNRHSEGGFSLIEMLIVMTVMIVIMGAVVALMKDALNVSNTIYEVTESQESVRIAHEYITRDLITAGSGLNGMNNIQVKDDFVSSYLSLNVVNDPARVGYVNLPIISSDADVPADVDVIGADPAVKILENSDRITILALDQTFDSVTIGAGDITGFGAVVSIAAADAGKFNTGEIYCFTSQTGAAFGAITNEVPGAAGKVNLQFAELNSYGLNDPTATGPIHLAGNGNGVGVSTQTVSLMRVKIINYYLNDRKELVKRVFGVAGAGFTDYLVAEHITDLSFRYFLGLSNADGTIQQPVYELTDSTQQVAVRQIETNIEAETTHPINYQTGVHNEITMTSMASIRNMQFRNAQQPEPPEEDE